MINKHKLCGVSVDLSGYKPSLKTGHLGILSTILEGESFAKLSVQWKRGNEKMLLLNILVGMHEKLRIRI